MVVVTAAEMRALDQWTIANDTPGHVLMAKAGRGAVQVLRPLLRKRRGPVVIVCGRGNNGGDGLVMARHLSRTRTVEVWLLAPAEEFRGDAAQMLAAWRGSGGRTRVLADAASVRTLAAHLPKAAGIVDAMFGTGLNAPVAGRAAQVVAAINAAEPPVLAVDIASGLCADTGRPLGEAIQATATATFGYLKVGHCLYPGVELSGAVRVVDIGIPDSARDAIGPAGRLLEAPELGAHLPRRPRASHKGIFGHVLVLGGSRGKLGAGLLAAEGVARAGAGLTTLLVPESLQPQAEGRVAELMTASMPDEEGMFAAPSDAQIRALLADRAAVVCGPGLGLGPGPTAFVAAVLRAAVAPVVLDADGLGAVVGTTMFRRRRQETIITPHPGEMSRLAGIETTAVQADRVGVARRFAAAEGVVCVLKGARTVIAAPDGRFAVCPTGNPGLASGGTGDVLAGIVGGLLSQGLAPFEAAGLAVYAHGLAADRLAERTGEVGMLARDVLTELPRTLASIQATCRS